MSKLFSYFEKRYIPLAQEAVANVKRHPLFTSTTIIKKDRSCDQSCLAYNQMRIAA